VFSRYNGIDAIESLHFEGGESVTSETFDQLLEALMSRKPFQVFTIELHGGQRFEIDHPRATVFREGVGVFIAPGGIPIWFDHDSVNQIIEAPASSAP
jgi:hypothetical protein